MSLLDRIKGIFGQGSISSKLALNKKIVGEITHFNYRKGYGFVEAPQFEKVFLHVSELSGKARKGKKVEFKIEKTDRGVKATEAVILN